MIILPSRQIKMDFEYGLIDIILVTNPPAQVGYWCPQSVLFDKMERGLITQKDLAQPIKINTPQKEAQDFSWLRSKISELIKYINA